MTIKTKFEIGDKVFTIDVSSMKVKEFVIKRISSYSNEHTTSIYLYDDDTYSGNSYNENKCFPTEAELMVFIKSKDDAETL